MQLQLQLPKNVNEITFPKNNHRNMFSTTLPQINDDFTSALSFCDDTIDIPNSRIGKLNRCRQFSFTWNWNIHFQDDMPLGEYRVICRVFNGNEENPVAITHDSFIVVNRPNSPQINSPYA